MSNEGPIWGEIRERGRPPTRVTRKQAAKILGINVENVRNLERRGLLHPFPDRYGAVRYDRFEVDALADRRRARGNGPARNVYLEHRVFEMLRQEIEDGVIAARTGLHLEEVEELHKRYLTGLTPSAPPTRTIDRADAKRIEVQAKLAARTERDFTSAVRGYARARERRIAAILPKPIKPRKGEE